MCTIPWWWTATVVGVDVLLTIAYFVIERFMAWSLPWYRRYASAVLFTIKVALDFDGRASWWRFVIGIVGVAAFTWNWKTFLDKRNGGGRKGKAESRLTEVQQVAFAREAQA